MEPSRITAEDAKYQIDQGQDILFLDMRNEKTWAEADQKLPGAIRIPVDEIEMHSINCRAIAASLRTVLDLRKLPVPVRHKS